MLKQKRRGSSTMNNDLDKGEKKWHDPEDSSNPYLYDDDYVEEDGNYYSKDTYDAMRKSDEEED